MKVSELIEILKYFDSESEVKIAYQPHYPLEVGIDNVADAVVEGENVVYISEDGRNDYLPGVAREEIGW